VRALRLHGLGVDASRALLGRRDLAGDTAAWGALVARYAGNPRALRVVGETVAAVFAGDIAVFLASDVAVFGDIRQLLDQQVARLSAQEHMVLCWLAAEREQVGFASLLTDLGPLLGRAAVVEAVEALVRRSLLEPRGGGAFSLAAMVREYATTCLGEEAGAVSHAGAAAGVGQGHGAVSPGASARAAAAGSTGSSVRRQAQQGSGWGAVGTVLRQHGYLQGGLPPDGVVGRVGVWRHRAAALRREMGRQDSAWPPTTSLSIASDAP
jgi:hypothetical protein